MSSEGGPSGGPVDLYLRKVVLPQRYGAAEVEWVEYALRSKLQRNGYWVTLAVIAVPAAQRYCLGASACSPEDRYEFSKQSAAQRAMGRATQVACRLLAGKLEDVLNHRQTLIGPESDCVWSFGSEGHPSHEWLKHATRALYEEVSVRAERTALEEVMKLVRRKFPRIFIAGWPL